MFVKVWLLLATLRLIYTCNEAVCGSIVSKCLLIKRCNCSSEDLSCSRDCFSCLNSLYPECCSCLDICPKVEASSEGSQIGDFPEAIPSLFDILTSTNDEEHFVTHTIPVEVDIDQFKKKQELRMVDSGKKLVLNCTVAFWSECTTWKKCKASCQSMGASKFRWFHDGCCECIGESCITYGLNESKCELCSKNSDQGLDEEELLDYGEEDYETFDE